MFLAFSWCLFVAPVVAAGEAGEQRLVVGDKVAPEWSTSLGSKSVGSIAGTPQGVLLQAEHRMHALVMRTNDRPGTDTNPLSVSVHMRTQLGCEGPTVPGLYVYWDNNNYLCMRISGEGHLFWCVVVKGVVVREQSFWNVLYDPITSDGKKWKEGYLRILLVSRNAAFYLSPDRINWQYVGEAGLRPGAPGQAPARIILGRGWTGEKDGKADLRNDYYPDGNKQLVRTLIADFVLMDGVGRPGDLPPVTKHDTWEQTLAALDSAGIPRSWSFLGPISFKDTQYKRPFPADLTDDWSVPLTVGGQTLKSSSWTHPQDEEVPDGYVDLAEHVGQATYVYAWAKTEVDWPVTGKALLWFSSADPMAIFVNNHVAYADPEDHQEWRAVKDRSCVPIALHKGRNTIKVRYRQNRGEWGFYLRLERDDPGYRIRLLEKMLELFPDQAAAGPGAPQRNWRAAQARHEIARCYEDMGDFAGALAAYDQAIAFFANDDENRLLALESKLGLLEFLRDGDGLVKAGEAHLAAFRGTAGASSALRAVLRGDVLAGRAEAAQARA
ncbi:MAG: hypothetical protein NTW87_06570, partial [Planctomycetota bacterium]|nr:hypothetical protein [Planctomycetota bacterium]